MKRYQDQKKDYMFWHPLSQEFLLFLRVTEQGMCCIISWTYIRRSAATSRRARGSLSKLSWRGRWTWWPWTWTWLGWTRSSTEDLVLSAAVSHLGFLMSTNFSCFSWNVRGLNDRGLRRGARRASHICGCCCPFWGLDPACCPR